MGVIASKERKALPGWLVSSWPYVFLAFLTMTILWVFIVWVVDNDYKKTEQDQVAQNNLLARALEEHVRRTLSASDDLLISIRDEYEQAGGISPALEIMINRMPSDPIRRQLSVIAVDGSLVASLVPVGSPSFLGHPLFEGHRNQDTGQMVVSEPRPGLVSGKPTIHLSRRINNFDGSFGGVVAIGLDADYFNRFYDTMGLQEGQWVRIVGLDGIIRAGRTGASFLRPGDSFQGQLFTLVREQPFGSFSSHGRTFGGRQSLQSYRLMTDYQLIVSAGIFLDIVFADFNERRRMYIQAGIVMTALIFGMFYTIAFRAWQRKKTEDRIRRSEAEHRLITDNLNDVIARHVDEKLVYVSPSGYELFGGTPAASVGQSSYAIIHPDDARKVRAEIDRLKSGEPSVRYEVRMMKADGSALLMDTIARVVPPLDPGQPQEILSISRNVTEQRLLEREAAYLERLAALGTMAASVTHEISQPLQAMKIKVSSLIYWREKGLPLSEKKFFEMAETVSGQIDRVAAIVQRLRDFVYRKDLAPDSVFDLRTSVAGALKMFDNQLHVSDIDLVLSMPPSPVNVKADPLQIEGAIINVISNAVQSLRTIEATRKLEIRLTVSEAVAVLEIENNGPGIPAEILHRIFDPFFTTKAQTDGLGLGLHIVETALKSIGGSVRAENRPGGVVFALTLPKESAPDAATC